MRKIPVIYFLDCKGHIFFKKIFVRHVPFVGTLLKVSGHHFVVTEVEQDLDAYIECHDDFQSPCEIVRAKLDVSRYTKVSCEHIIESLMEDSWLQ